MAWPKSSHWTTEQARLRGSKGGKTSGAARHKRALVKAAEKCKGFLGRDLEPALSREQYARVLLALSRSYRLGYHTGYYTGARVRIREREAA